MVTAGTPRRRPSTTGHSRWALAMVLSAMTAAAAAPASAAGKGAGAPKKPAGSATGVGGKSDARSQAKAAVERAQVDYKLGRFQDALDGYRRAYELFQAPVLLFDIGQCHRNLGDPDKAIFFFEGYLREETGPEPERRKLTEDLLVELRTDAQRKRASAAVAAAAAARAAAPPPRLVRPSLHLVAADHTPVASTTLLASVPEGPPGGRRSLVTRWWFWTAIGGALAAGATVYYLTGEPRLVQPSIGVYTPQPPAASP